MCVLSMVKRLIHEEQKDKKTYCLHVTSNSHQHSILFDFDQDPTYFSITNQYIIGPFEYHRCENVFYSAKPDANRWVTVVEDLCEKVCQSGGRRKDVEIGGNKYKVMGKRRSI